MKMTKKFIALSLCIIAVLLMVAMGTLSLSCVIATIMSLIFGLWKDAVVAVALGYIAALGAFSFLDASDWFLDIYRGLKKHE